MSEDAAGVVQVTDRDVERVMAEVTRDRLLAAVRGVVGIASPTGHEAPVAAWIARRLAESGIEAETHPLDPLQANAVARLPGRANGPSILLYAPLDTFTTGDPEHDLPWAGPRMRPDMCAVATVHADIVEGLGAGNPKGHAACVLVALEALHLSGLALAGDVVAGFGAGGMPTFAIAGVGTAGRENTGHGAGAAFLLERGWSTDYAVIAKPGWTVSHEEVGLVWLDVLVPGIHTYVGSRHRLPYRNAIVVAGEVASALEPWLEEYAGRHETGTMRPQGVIGSVAGGWQRLVAATPALVRLRLDLRITTRQTAAGVLREVREQVQHIGAELGVDLRVEQVAAVPASHTPPDSPVVRAAVAAWEKVAGQRHEPITQNSGATDANILRMRGVPTARVGMPKVSQAPDGGPVDFTHGMNLADLREMRKLVEILIRTVLGVQSGAASSER
jgi:succinyl-diaminopimelate desuccinylase